MNWQRHVPFVKKCLSSQILSDPSKNAVTIDSLMHNRRRNATLSQRNDKFLALFHEQRINPIGALPIVSTFKQLQSRHAVERTAVKPCNIAVPSQIFRKVREIA